MSSKKYCPSGNTDIISVYLLISGRYSSLSAYGQSKLANILHANELARRLKVSVFFINLNRNQKLFVTTGQLCTCAILSKGKSEASIWFLWWLLWLQNMEILVLSSDKASVGFVAFIRFVLSAFWSMTMCSLNRKKGNK